MSKGSVTTRYMFIYLFHDEDIKASKQKMADYL